MSKAALVVGLGYEANSGKDACVKHLMALYSGSKIIHTSFARELRYEIHNEMYDVMADHRCSSSEALQAMCERERVEFDPFASKSEMDPFGKQRRLLQAWGMRQRAIDPFYWIHKVAQEISSSQADLVLISDLRFVNEAEFIRDRGGKTIKVHRPIKDKLEGHAAKHVSEHELADYAFDYTILNNGILKQLHNKVAAVYLQILQLPRSEE